MVEIASAVETHRIDAGLECALCDGLSDDSRSLDAVFALAVRTELLVIGGSSNEGLAEIVVYDLCIDGLVASVDGKAGTLGGTADMLANR